jgi:hypothetical protein
MVSEATVQKCKNELPLDRMIGSQQREPKSTKEGSKEGNSVPLHPWLGLLRPICLDRCFLGGQPLDTPDWLRSGLSMASLHKKVNKVPANRIRGSRAMAATLSYPFFSHLILTYPHTLCNLLPGGNPKPRTLFPRTWCRQSM